MHNAAKEVFISKKRKKEKQNKQIDKSLQKRRIGVGLEPPTFRLTAERADQLRHGGIDRRVENSVQLL